MLLPKLTKSIATIRSRVRYLRYASSQRKNGDFTQLMADTLFLNPNRHPVMMGPEELSRFFVYSSNKHR
jgi:hypothetical protein